MVERRANPKDRRAWLIALRPDGAQQTTPILEIDTLLRGELRRSISRPERQRLASLLLRLQTNIAGVLDEDL
ncbi:MAG: hypothetical protein H8E78_07515 [Proteobacteria bacterium]|nr:hypothetical protein [Pseudomonadota bacterium]